MGGYTSDLDFQGVKKNLTVKLTFVNLFFLKASLVKGVLIHTYYIHMRLKATCMLLFPSVDINFITLNIGKCSLAIYLTISRTRHTQIFI